PLDRVEGGRVSRIYLERIGHAAARHEVDAVDSHEAKLAGDGIGDPARAVGQTGVGPAEDVPAIPEGPGAERPLAREQARHAQRHRATPVRGEHDRAGYARDPLLQVAPDRHAPAAAPRNAPAAA